MAYTADMDARQQAAYEKIGASIDARMQSENQMKQYMWDQMQAEKAKQAERSWGERFQSMSSGAMAGFAAGGPWGAAAGAGIGLVGGELAHKYGGGDEGAAGFDQLGRTAGMVGAMNRTDQARAAGRMGSGSSAAMASAPAPVGGYAGTDGARMMNPYPTGIPAVQPRPPQTYQGGVGGVVGVRPVRSQYGA